MIRAGCAWLLAVAVLFTGQTAAGAVVSWINAAGGTYEVGSNWSTGTVPGPADTASFGLPGPYTVVVTQGGAKARFSLSGDLTINLSSLTVSTPSLDIAGTARIMSGTITSNGAVTVSINSTLNLQNASVNAGVNTVTFSAGSAFYADHGNISGNASVFLGTSITLLRGNMNFNGFSTPVGTTTLIDGVGSIRADSLTMRGAVTVRNGGTIAGNTSTPVELKSCTLDISGSGSVLNNANSDALSAITVGTGAQFRNGTHSGTISVLTGGNIGGGTYNGLVTVASGATATFGGFAGGLHADQNGLFSTCFGIQNGLTLEVDGLTPPLQPVFQFSSGTLSGPFAVNVRHPNALRVGQVLPVLQYLDSNTQPGNTFSSFTAPPLGGGRVLTMTNGGSPRKINLVVVAGGSPCWGADFDGDGVAGTPQDVAAFFACVGGSCCANCGSADFDGDGDMGTDADINAFFRVLAGGAC